MKGFFAILYSEPCCLTSCAIEICSGYFCTPPQESNLRLVQIRILGKKPFGSTTLLLWSHLFLLQNSANLKSETNRRLVLTILRHFKRIREIRGPGTAIFLTYLLCSLQKHTHTPGRCWESGIIYSGSGYDFSEFRIRPQLFKTCLVFLNTLNQSKMHLNICHTKRGKNPKNTKSFIFIFAGSGKKFGFRKKSFGFKTMLGDERRTLLGRVGVKRGKFNKQDDFCASLKKNL